MSVLVRHIGAVPAPQFHGFFLPQSQIESTRLRPVCTVAARLASLIARYVLTGSRPSASPPHQSTLTKSKPQRWNCSMSCR